MLDYCITTKTSYPDTPEQPGRAQGRHTHLKDTRLQVEINPWLGS